jgi:twitching motility protein PilT
MFQLMKERRASDLFLKAGAPPYMRIDGVVAPVEGMGMLLPSDTESFALSLMTEQQSAMFERSPDLDFARREEGVGHFRINVLRQRGTVSLVIRLVHPGELGFEELGLPSVLGRLADRPRGLVLVTGAAGSGKSTTVAAMVYHINRTRRGHIVTIEDPIEYVHRDMRCIVQQRQVGQDTASFAEALRHVIRQSPDVIVIGEIRDRETIQTAISAGQTGHLVITTMHTSDTVQTLDRIVNYYPDYVRSQVRKDLSICLQGTISQRLLPRADGRGRVPAVEVMVSIPGIRKALAEGRHQDVVEMMARHGDLGMCTLDQALARLVKAGRVTMEEALWHASNPEALSLKLDGMEVARRDLELGP